MSRPLDILLGRLAVERCGLTPAQIQQALACQESQDPRPPLGVVFVEFGWLTHEQVEDLLRVQSRDSPESPSRIDAHASVWRFGRLAIRSGRVPAERVNAALREQARREDLGEPWALLGEILVAQGAMTPADVDELLRLQQEERVPAPATARVTPVLADATVLLADATTAPPAGPAGKTLPVNQTVIGLPAAAGFAGRGDAKTQLRPGGAPEALPPESADPAAAPSGSRTLGKYQLVHELGRGGMGVVYKAWHPALKSYFAVKVLLSGGHASPDEIRRFQREAQAAARLKHPGILAVHDISEADGKTYFAMEYIEGVGLDKVMKDPVTFGIAPGQGSSGAGGRGGINVSTALQWTREIAEALQAAHEAGVVHRDLKPANVIREARGGRLKVMDFGLAKLVDEAGGTGATRTGVLMGTPAYMSPEQAAGEVRRIDARSDVYQIGAILYELLTGRPPYEGATGMDVVLQVMQQDPIPPRRLDPTIDRDAATICMKAMARTQEKRYASAQALAEDCGRCLNDEPILARPESWWEKPVRWARRRKALAAVGGAGILAVVVAGGVGLYALRVGAEKDREHRAHEQTARERETLRTKVLAKLRKEAGLYVDATLQLRRSGVTVAKLQRYLAPMEESAEEARSELPEAPEPYYYMGRMYRALMDFKQAKDEQDRALAKDADFIPSLYERVVLLSMDYRARLRQLKDAWLAAEGTRLAAGGGLAKGGGGGEKMGQVPSNDDLVGKDAEAQRIERALATDAARLEGNGAESSGSALSPAMRKAARALWLQAGSQRKEDREEAHALFAQALKEDPALEEAVEGCAEAAESYEEHVAVIARGIEADKGYVPYWRWRGDARLSWGNYEADHGEDPGPRWQEAAADYAKALELNPAYAEAWLGRGKLRSSLGTYKQNRGGDPGPFFEEAAADFGKALGLKTTFAEAWMSRGLLRTNWGDHKATRGDDPGPLWQDAAVDFGKALELNPSSALAWRRRGNVRQNWGVHKMNRGEDPVPLYQEAAADYGKALELNPSDAWVWMSRGVLRTNWGSQMRDRGEDAGPHFQDAVADFGKALELNSADPEAWRRLGDLRMKYASYKASYGDDPGTLCRDAAADFSKALELNPAYAKTWMDRGVVRTVWGDHKAHSGENPAPLYQDAIDDCSKALQLNPAYAEAWMRRGNVRANWGLHKATRGEDPGRLYQDAAADYGKALELDPRSAEAWMSRGDVRMNWGWNKQTRGEDPGPLYQGAAADYDKALELNPAHPGAWMRRGMVRTNWGLHKVDRGEDPGPFYQDAAADFGKALELNPSSAEAWMRRGLLHMNWGYYQANRGEDPEPLYQVAAADYSKALELNQAYAEAWMRRGMVRTNWGNYKHNCGQDPGPLWQDAAIDFGKALELDPAYAEASLRRGDVRMNWGLHKANRGEDPGPLFHDAATDFGKALELNPASAEARWRRGWLLHTKHHWADAVSDFEAAIRLDPSYEPIIRAPLAMARCNLQFAVAPAWLAALTRGDSAISSGDYAAARTAYAEGIAAFGAQSQPERDRLLADPSARQVVLGAHYGIACALSLASVGRDRPGAKSRDLPLDLAVRLRGDAFRNLEAAIRLGWNDRSHVETDPDLGPLHGDARWNQLLESIRQ